MADPLSAAVVAGGSLISGASSIFGANTQAKAATQAAQLQAQSSANALALQNSMFNTAQGDITPFMNAGAGVLPTLTALETPGANQTATLSQMPGFQFQSQWGTMAAQNALAAQGLGGSRGPLSTAISSYNNGLAGTYYQNAVNNLQTTANMGAGSANALASGAINAGNAMAGTQQNIGTAQASGVLGSANATAGGITSAGGAANNALLMSSLLGGAGGASNGGLYGGVNGTLSGFSSPNFMNY